MFAIFFTVDMHDQQKHDAVYQSDGLPPVFATLDTILFSACMRIEEHTRRSLEGHAMLLSIACGFQEVPFKSQVAPVENAKNATTKL